MKILVPSRLLPTLAALLIAQSGWAALASYSQNFEALTAASSTALSGVGFQVAGTVYNGNTGASPPYGAFKSFYGNFAAPNGTGAFSAVATGEGGGAQGAKYLNAFSDYNCCATVDGHRDTNPPFDFVQSSVFQEQVIAAANIGATWTLTFDAKLPSSNGCGTVAISDCIAFIRTLDPNNSFATIYRATFDAQTLSTTNWSTHVLSFQLSDPALSGQILQFGFQSVSRQYGNSGVYYDNIVFQSLTPDADGDGIADSVDNCPAVANSDQADTDGDARGDLCDNCRLLANNSGAGAQCDSDNDGFGNRCDGDFNNNSATNAQDTTLFRQRLGQPSVAPTYNAADLNCNGSVNAQDTTLFRQLLGAPPGPGAGSSGSQFTIRPLPAIYTTGKAVNYSAFRAGGPGVGEVPSDASVLQDLGLLHNAGFNLLRLFGADAVSDKILRLAAANYPEMKFQQGIFLRGPTPLSCVDTVNSAQVATGIQLANQYPNVVTVSVGNETSLGTGLTISCLLSYVQTVRSQVVQPVTTDDIAAFYSGGLPGYQPDPVLAAIDFVSAHTYPFLGYVFWNWQQTGTPAGPARAAAMMNASLAQAQAEYASVSAHLYRNASGNTVSIGASLPIVIGEIGWKAVQTNTSSPIETYAANPVNAKWHHDLLAGWQGTQGGPVRIFIFQAFDEAWKGNDDGWGLWDKFRAPRYGLCGTPAGSPCNSNVYQGAGYYPF
ncbi:MAG: thrombospondin type 3 repeat-containing protein [Gammaproteobacteria bacterium]